LSLQEDGSSGVLRQEAVESPKQAGLSGPGVAGDDRRAETVCAEEWQKLRLEFSFDVQTLREATDALFGLTEAQHDIGLIVSRSAQVLDFREGAARKGSGGLDAFAGSLGLDGEVVRDCGMCESFADGGDVVPCLGCLNAGLTDPVVSIVLGDGLCDDEIRDSVDDLVEEATLWFVGLGKDGCEEGLEVRG
jgi:hypothetical protein